AAKALVGAEESAELLDEGLAELADVLDLGEEPALDKTGDNPVVAPRALVGLELLGFENAEDPHGDDRTDRQAHFGKDEQIEGIAVASESRRHEGEVEREHHAERKEFADPETMAFGIVID